MNIYREKREGRPRNQKLQKNQATIENVRPIVDEFKITKLSVMNIAFVMKKLKLQSKYKASVSAVMNRVFALQRHEQIDLHRQKFTPFNNRDATFLEKVTCLFQYFDDIILNGRLKNKVSIKMEEKKTMKLNTGESRYDEDEEVKCDIVFSYYYITNFDRLCTTLLHEMCHCAQWLLNNDLIFGAAAHDDIWHEWTRKCMIKFPIIEIKVTQNWR